MIRSAVLRLWIAAPAPAEAGLPETAVRFQTKLVEGKPECYTVSHGVITGTNERGLMYGLLEPRTRFAPPAAWRMLPAVPQ